VFGSLKVTCVHVSLACPISSDVFIHARHSEESLEETRIFTETIIQKTIWKIIKKLPAVRECVHACMRACVRAVSAVHECVRGCFRACVHSASMRVRVLVSVCESKCL